MSLDADLLAAHAENDLSLLVGLYRQAAWEAKDDRSQGFYLTHAYVFALELGDPRAIDLAAELIEQGRL